MRAIVTVEMVGRYCVTSYTITCILHPLCKVFYGISICIICNIGGVSDIL